MSIDPCRLCGGLGWVPLPGTPDSGPCWACGVLDPWSFLPQAWDQYDRGQAGYHRDNIPRKARRQRETMAVGLGLLQPTLAPLMRWGVPCGAPGLVGVAHSAEAQDVRRRRAYGPGPGVLP